LRLLGHESLDVRDAGMGAAQDSAIARYAQEQRFCLLTGDFGFADIRSYPPQDYFGIVVLAIPEKANRDQILRLVRNFAADGELLQHLPGRLAIVESGRVRLRPGLMQ